MSDLNTELEHLAEADRHISEAHARIAEAASRIHSRNLGEGRLQALELLESMNTTLAAFEQHRRSILAAIAP